VQIGTGSWLSETNTGTSPIDWESDGDGVADGIEVIAGTDPNNPADHLRINDVAVLNDGSVRLTWRGPEEPTVLSRRRNSRSIGRTSSRWKARTTSRWRRMG
jgi:hypothetical protein